MILTRAFYYLVSALSVVAAQNPTCTAIVSVDSSQPGHAAYMYHDIYVENTGSCPITKAIASITLPPMATAQYHNVSSETGELFGISYPLLPANTELGGTVVLNSARIPMISLGSIECEASCMGNTPTTPVSTRSVRTPTQTTKVEIQWGSNPRWLALSLIDDLDTSDVWIVDSKNSRQLMKRENWDTKIAYTFSPGGADPMELPLSVELKSQDGEVIALKDFITSFSYAVIDTQAAFSHTPVTPADYSLRLVAHPSSNLHWVALTPYGTQANKVTAISIKASNTQYVPMEFTSIGFFSISSPNLALRLPISARITFEDGHVLDMENVVAF